ncbi:MAG: hypothetical protein IKW74_02510 [Thermoguttaceae bacterium]|nr:hypothetical protein [Thermoguttaceae bacterium]
MPNANTRISFAHNARTVCIAFVAFAARYHKGNISDKNLDTVFNAGSSESAAESLYKVSRSLEGMRKLLPFENKDLYDAKLDKLFKAIIEAGITHYNIACKYESTLTATNFLKKDKNYYEILGTHWSRLRAEIHETFSDTKET